jgi:polyhydroxyalkanoate synthesis regulator phasin
MSAEERRKILQMVADGKISAEEAAKLMRTLDESAEAEVEVLEAVLGGRCASR